MDTKAIGKILGEKFDGVAGDGALALAELGLAPDAAILDVGTGKVYFHLSGFAGLSGDGRTEYR